MGVGHVQVPRAVRVDGAYGAREQRRACRGRRPARKGPRPAGTVPRQKANVGTTGKRKDPPGSNRGVKS